MGIYKISKGQLWIVRIISIILALTLLVLAVDNGSAYFIFGLLVIGSYLFYEVGWHSANKKVRKSQATKQELTDEDRSYLKKWSWGALFLGFWWTLFSRIKVYSLLFLIPFANLFFFFFFGKKGRRFSWEKGNWKSFEEFQKRQKKLDKIGKIFIILYVIVAVGILSTLLLLQLGTARAKARDAKRIADMNQIRSGLELYFDDRGVYPNELSELATSNIIDVPKDPLGGQNYNYTPLDGTGVFYANAGTNVRSCASTACPAIAKIPNRRIVDVEPYFLANDWYKWQFYFTETPYKNEVGYIHQSALQSVNSKNGRYHLWTNLEAWHSVLSSDADINSEDKLYGINGLRESCNSDFPLECIYDLGAQE